MRCEGITQPQHNPNDYTHVVYNVYTFLFEMFKTTKNPHRIVPPFKNQLEEA